MTQQINIAILGATGVVGEMIQELLVAREFPLGDLFLLASEQSAGKTYRVRGKSLTVQDVTQFDWSQTHLAIFSAGAERAAHWAPIAAEAGTIVIDNSSCFRYEYDVPLVIPEVNGQTIAEYRNQNIIANPNCSTIQLLMALKPIEDAVGIERINVCSYQSVSGAGQAAIEQLAGETAQLLNGQSIEPGHLPTQIAFNCLPQIDEFLENGYSKEEMKMCWETQKIFNNPNLQVNATCVRVPVFYGHALAVHLETSQTIDAEQVIELLTEVEGIDVFRTPDYPTQVVDANGSDRVQVGRIRNDISHPQGINLWITADNTRKGAATNAVQIAEALVQNYF